MEQALLAAMLIFTDKRMEDRTTDPLIPIEKVETVAELSHPPGNVAVADDGRVFFSFHSLAKPPIQVAELINGQAVAFPSNEYQKKFKSILSVRMDRKGQLWVLDFAEFGFKQPKLFAFDIKTKTLTHEFEFPRSIAGWGSMLNDMQIDANSEYIYIADNSLLSMTPSILIYNTQTRELRQILKKHNSVVNQGYKVYVEGNPLFGSDVFHGLDPITLDSTGTWLYYGPLNGDYLYRLKVTDILNRQLTDAELEARIEVYGKRTMSDGIIADSGGNIYLTDFEHSAIVRMTPDGKLETLLKDKKLRWPDGFSFSPDGWLYFTCAAIPDVMFKSKKQIQEKAPYHIFRFRP